MSHHDGRTEDSRDDWATPWEYIQAVESRFGAFTLDVCCTEETTKVQGNFITPGDDALSMLWGPGESAWWNPPYDELKKGQWGKHAAASARLEDTIVFGLTPVRTGSDWWRWLVFESGVCDEVIFNYPRIKFLVGGVPMERPAFDTNLLILHADAGPAPRFSPREWTQARQRPLFGIDKPQNRRINE